MSATNGNGKINLDGPGAAYLRVSDDQQDTLRQYESLRGFEKRHGVTIPDANWFKDEGWARDTADRRPDFVRLMKLVEAGKIKWIVVSERDRFGTKNSKQLISYLYRLEEAGCKLYDTVDKEWTGEDIATVITAVVDGEKSKGEQHGISKRGLSAKVAQARDGEWQGGLPRLGFDVVCYSRATGAELWRVVVEGFHKRLKVYPDGRQERCDGEGNVHKCQRKIEVLRLAPSSDKAKIAAAASVFTRFATESVSENELAHYLNKLGFLTAQGNPFIGHHVKDMLADPIYIGYYAWNRTHCGKFHRWTEGQAVLEPNYDEKGSRNRRDDWVLSRRLFDPLVDRETWEAVQRKLDRPKRESAPRSAALYLAGLVVCGNCGSKMVAGRGRSSKTGSEPLRFEFVCGGYHRNIRYKNHPLRKHDGCTCLRNGVYQHELEVYVNRYLEETGHRLDLLMRAPENGDHLTDRLEGQEDDAWQAFSDGLTRLCEYLAQHHPDEYSALLEEEAARREQEQWEREANGYHPSTPGTLARVAQKVFAEGDALAQHHPSLPPSDFVRDVVATYRSVFDPAGLAAEVQRLEAEHTAMMRLYADLPTPRAKEKAKAELAALEGRIAGMEGQQQNAADVIEGYYRQMTDLQGAIRAARLAMKGENDAQALRRRAEALRGIVQRIECTFTATGPRGKGRRRKDTQLVKVSIHPVVGDARHFLVESCNVLRAMRATSPM